MSDTSLQGRRRLGPGRVLTISLAWSACVSACVAWHLITIGWHIDRTLVSAVVPYAISALVAGIFTQWVMSRRLVARNMGQRFAGTVVLLGGLTLAITMIFVLIQYRSYFAQWHGEFPSIEWFVQLAFTGVGSIYLFLSSGLRPLLPWGLAFLFLFSWVISSGRYQPTR